MEELSINIKILDRAYPMKAQAMEETYLRTAGKLINEQLNVYKTKFSIDDKQDLLAMAGLDNLITLRKQENAADLQISNLKKRITGLTARIDKVLQQ